MQSTEDFRIGTLFALRHVSGAHGQKRRAHRFIDEARKDEDEPEG